MYINIAINTFSPYLHRYHHLTNADWKSPDAIFNIYIGMMKDLNLMVKNPQPGGMSTRAYNLLIDDSWIMVIPRSKSLVGKVKITALAFAGLFFLEGEDELTWLKNYHTLTVLTDAGVDRLKHS